MPRKIGYGTFTPARKAALKKAQLESARKRRKFKSEDRSTRKSRKRQMAAAALLAAGAGMMYYQQKQEEKKRIQWNANIDAMLNNISKTTQEAANYDDSSTRLRALAGNVYGPAESEEQWKARVDLYGEKGVIGEFSSMHEGRAEIFPTVPWQEASSTLFSEGISPSYRLSDDNPDEDYVILYHRTGGGKDVDPAKAKEEILRNQTMKALNRDEARGVAQGLADASILEDQSSWWSNRLNDSNTRAAFGEHVVKVRLPKSMIPRVETQTFGKLSPINESWVKIPQGVLDGISIEDVAPDEIKPPPERKFRAPK
jgi:hypothetical protein